MSAKMKRRRRHDRLKRIRTERRENALYFGRGTIPASARSVAMCACGAVAFSRGDDHDFHGNFYEAHAWCDEEVAR